MSGKMKSCDYFKEIGSHFQKFRQMEFLCDTILVADDRELKAHSVILAAASQVFKSTFEASGEPGLHYIHLPGYGSKVVEVALNVIYTGNLVIPEEYHDDETQLELFESLQNLGLELSTMNCEINFAENVNTPVNGKASMFQQVCIKHENGDGSSARLESILEVNSESISQSLVPVENSELEEFNETEDEHIWNSGTMKSEKLELDSETIEEDGEESSQMKLYFCNLCNKTFSHLKYLEVHKRTHTGEKPFVCNVCGRRFSQRANLNRHTLGHLGEKPNLCHICGKAFIQKTQLDEHLLQHGDNGTSTCKICSQVFNDRVLLRQHIVRCHPKGHTKVAGGSEEGTKSHVCNACGKGYSTLGGLRMHLRSHTGQTVACSICNKAFVNHALLLQHLRSHTKEKTYECTTCGKAFIYKNALTVHTRVHTGEKPYRCSVCGHTYSQFGHLQSHKKTHTGEKPFICSVCCKAYRQKVDLRLHMNRIHRAATSIKAEITAD